MAKKPETPSKAFSSAFIFKLDGVTSAVLDANGKLSLRGEAKGEQGTLEEFKSWKHYVKDVMEDTPVSEDNETDVLDQLSMLLGSYEPIVVREPNTTQRKGKAANTATESDSETGEAEKEKEKEMATAVAKKTVTKAVAKKAPAKAATKKAVVEKVMQPCTCGCGTPTGSLFAPGHDARVHGWGKKINDGRMKFSEISQFPTAVKFLKDHGIKQGVAAK